MDAVVVLGISKWIMAELIRLFHSTDTSTATAVVDALVERTVPIIWDVGGRQRVLDPSLSQADRTLLLLYGNKDVVAEADLVDWIETKNPSSYRKNVLVALHKKKWIEYDSVDRTVRLSPLGANHVELTLPLTATV